MNGQHRQQHDIYGAAHAAGLSARLSASEAQRSSSSSWFVVSWRWVVEMQVFGDYAGRGISKAIVSARSSFNLQTYHIPVHSKEPTHPHRRPRPPSVVPTSQAATAMSTSLSSTSSAVQVRMLHLRPPTLCASCASIAASEVGPSPARPPHTAHHRAESLLHRNPSPPSSLARRRARGGLPQVVVASEPAAVGCEGVSGGVPFE